MVDKKREKRLLGLRERYRLWKERNANHCEECGKKIRPDSVYCKSHSKTKDKNPHWNGGRFVHHGYVYVKAPNHPFASQWGYVLEHRLVMEAHVGRTLLPTEVVHHIDGNTENNNLENLMLFSNPGEHTRLHRLGKPLGTWGWVYSTTPAAIRSRKSREKERKKQ